ncbi:hypothetical protein [Mycobacterium kubicae]|uniref:hypothetical protein n=1 Tax=Mycobacterium kubicae TaxID=120959 RepID=UPI0007FD5C3A|nr:hypothetical protein [Mycobacterium kubicae]OBK53021.1 hypothetical protein A5657_15845 [Mycobacterium kubicae]
MPSQEPEPSLAQAEQEVASAQARAEAARARAADLRRRAQELLAEPGETTDDSTDAPELGDSAAPELLSDTSRRRRRVKLRLPRPRRPGRKALALSAAATVVCGALAASGYVLHYHRTAEQQRQRTAEIAAVARQNAVTLMAIDANKAREDIQHVIDISTGQFKLGMLLAAEDMVKQVQQSKVSTKVTVEGVAVQSATDNSAVVLVAAKAEASGPDRKPPPHQWRIVMTLQQENGQLKIAAIEALP